MGAGATGSGQDCYLLRAVEHIRQFRQFIIGGTQIRFGLRKMQARILPDRPAQADVTWQDYDRYTTLGDRGLYGYL
jgi:hypothetical protein